MSLLKHPVEIVSGLTWKKTKPKNGWDTYSKISKQVVCIRQYLKEKQQILMLHWKHFNIEITPQKTCRFIKTSIAPRF